VLAVRSSKEFMLSTIKDDILKIGRPVLIAIDKASVGNTAEKLAASFGCGIYKPEKNMLVEDKASLTSGKQFSNDHERDALASALTAYNACSTLFSKIDTMMHSRNMSSYSDEVKSMIIEKKAKNIIEAIDMILDIDVHEEKDEKKKENVDWEAIARGLRQKLKEETKRYEIIKIYADKLEEKSKTLEKQKEQMLSDEKEKNMDARKEIMKDKDMKSKDILIKQMQFELNKQRDIKMAYERKTGREEEAKDLEDDGYTPVVPVNDFDADEITKANLEYGLNDQIVWFKSTKPSKMAARAIIALSPKIIIADFNGEIRGMLEKSGITIVENVEVKMGDFYAAVSENVIKTAIKNSERKSFMDWLNGYKNRLIS